MPEKFCNEYNEIHLSPHFPWYFNSETISPDIKLNYKNNFNQKEIGQFTHMYYTDGKSNSEIFNVVSKILDVMTEKHNLKFSDIFRIKGNFLYNIKRDEKTIQPIHTDIVGSKNFISMIYYINDSDGDTYFFNKDNTLKKKISPKRNRIILFNSEIPHAGQNPVENEYRIITNFVLKK